jgi:hypothetical protein
MKKLIIFLILILTLSGCVETLLPMAGKAVLGLGGAAKGGIDVNMAGEAKTQTIIGDKTEQEFEVEGDMNMTQEKRTGGQEFAGDVGTVQVSGVPWYFILLFGFVCPSPFAIYDKILKRIKLRKENKRWVERLDRI